jgi:Mrp family chromosome partitioning ATPase
LEMDKISNINVVEPATYPVNPIRPKKMLNVALGFFLGLLGGIALAFITEYADHSLKTPEDVAAKLHLQTLATVPFAAAHEVPVVSEKRLDETPSVVGNEGTGSCEAQFLARREREAGADHATKVGSWEAQFRASRKQGEPNRTAAGNVGKEAVAKWGTPIESRALYGTLRDRLLMAAAGSLESPCIFGLTSCRTGEGVSSIATNLALALAQQYAGGGVLLINASAIDNSEGDGFHLEANPLCCPKKMAFDLRETYEIQGLAKLLPLLKEHYRFVVFDLPAIRQASSVVRLTGMVDGVVFVVEAEGVRWEEAKGTTDLLVQARANLLGAVLNKRRAYVPEWLSRRL